MEIKETESCADPNCGCNMSNFPTDEKCPNCGGRLRLTGNVRTLVLRLSCPGCGHQGQLLSQAELQELL